MPTAPVTAVVVSKLPRPDHYMRTLQSLAEQNEPPNETILVDSTEGGHIAENENCSICNDTIKRGVRELERAGSTVRTIHSPDSGIGEARKLGLEESNEPAVWHLDEDAVILSEDWTQRALAQLDEGGVAGVGGNVAPLEENTVGKVFAGADAATQGFPGGWYIMYPRRLCMEDGQCLMYGQGRGEDMTTREQLAEYGELRRDPELLAQKDLPTSRQDSAKNAILSAAGGAVAGTVASKFIDGVTDRLL